MGNKSKRAAKYRAAKRASKPRRVRDAQIVRPFMYGSTAWPFDDDKNPKPPGVPDHHTHLFEVFVKGVADEDMTYWLQRVRFQLHRSIGDSNRSMFFSPQYLYIFDPLADEYLCSC